MDINNCTGDHKGKRVVYGQYKSGNYASVQQGEHNSTQTEDNSYTIMQAQQQGSAILPYMSCEQGNPQFTLTPRLRPVAKRLQARVLMLQNPQLLVSRVQGLQPIGEAASLGTTSENTSMSASHRPLDDENVVDDQEQIIAQLLAGLSLAEADVVETEQQNDTSVIDMSVNSASDVLSAGQQRLLQHGGAAMDITSPMQSHTSPDVSVGVETSSVRVAEPHGPQQGHNARLPIANTDLQGRGAIGNDDDLDTDMLLGGFPEALSVHRSSNDDSVVQQLTYSDGMQTDQFVDVYDVDELEDNVDFSQHPSAQALAQQLQIAQMQVQLAQEQSLRQQRELELRERELQIQQRELERTQREQQWQLQLQAQQLENERLLRESERQQHELFVFHQMQEDDFGNSASVSVSPEQQDVSLYREVAAHEFGIQQNVKSVPEVIVPVPSVSNLQNLSTPVAEAIGQSSGTAQQQQPQLVQSRPAQPSLVPNSVKLEKPSTFSGKHADVQNWLFEMRQYIDSVGLGSYGNACRFIVTYLKGQAQTWWRMFSIDHKVAGSASIFDTLDVDTLLSELEQQFSDVDRELKLRDRILNIKQRGTVQEFTSQFKSLQIELGSGRLDDKTAFHIYQAGLQPHIRLQVMLKDPKTISDLELYAERYARAHEAFAQSGGHGSGVARNSHHNSYRGGSHGGSRGGNRGANRGGHRFQYKTFSNKQQWGGNNGRNFNSRYNPNSYQNVSQYSNSQFKGSSPMVVNNALRGGKSNSTPPKRFQGNCNYCGRAGHKASACYKQQHDLQQQQQQSQGGGFGANKGKQIAFNNVMQQQQQQQQQQSGPPYFTPQINTIQYSDIVQSGNVGASSSGHGWNPNAPTGNSIMKSQSKN